MINVHLHYSTKKSNKKHDKSGRKDEKKLDIIKEYNRVIPTKIHEDYIWDMTKNREEKQKDIGWVNIRSKGENWKDGKTKKADIQRKYEKDEASKQKRKKTKWTKRNKRSSEYGKLQKIEDG